MSYEISVWHRKQRRFLCEHRRICTTECVDLIISKLESKLKLREDVNHIEIRNRKQFCVEERNGELHLLNMGGLSEFTDTSCISNSVHSKNAMVGVET